MLSIPTDIAIIMLLGILAVFLVTLDYENSEASSSERTTAIVSSCFTSLVVLAGYVLACVFCGTL